MITNNYKALAIISIERAESEQLVATLFSQATGLVGTPFEYIRLHPTLTEQTKIVDQARYAADDKNDYFAIFSPDEEQFATLFSSLHKQHKSCLVVGSHALSRRVVTHSKQATEDTGLVKNRVILELSVAPGPPGEGWTFSMGGNIPLQTIQSLHHGLTVCCALGSDGCSPLTDVVVKVISIDARCIDAFAFRQRAAIYRAVRRCFLKLFA